MTCHGTTTIPHAPIQHDCQACPLCATVAIMRILNALATTERALTDAERELTRIAGFGNTLGPSDEAVIAREAVRRVGR